MKDFQINIITEFHHYYFETQHKNYIRISTHRIHMVIIRHNRSNFDIFKEEKLVFH